MEKVKVSKEVSEALVSAKADGIESPELIRDYAITHGFSKRSGYLSVIGSINIDTLIRALYIGYEVEQTPEDKVREFYYKNSKFPEIAHVIRETVIMLGHKIEGVNA